MTGEGPQTPEAWIEAHGAELVRGDALPEGMHAALAGDPGGQALLAGAEALRADLNAWETPEPPDDLIERTLARMALAGAGGAAPGEAKRGEVLPLPTPRRVRRRTSVEILTTPLGAPGDPARPPTQRGLLLRLCLQAAAAIVLFGVCTTFVAVFYPAIGYALEDRRVERCQQQLRRLQEAALRYRSERPDAPALRGGELRRALIEGGYADELDFTCPGHRGEALRERSYVGFLPAGSAALSPHQPVFWDRFGNHSVGFCVVSAGGKVERIDVESFATWQLLRRGDEASEGNDSR